MLVIPKALKSGNLYQKGLNYLEYAVIEKNCQLGGRIKKEGGERKERPRRGARGGGGGWKEGRMASHMINSL